MFENCAQIILKVTKDCNLRCQYCYVKEKDHYKGQNMSFNTYKQLILRVKKDHYKSLSRPNSLQIVFHGGEPTLLGKSEFQRFIDYARSQFPHISFSIQTNLTKIDEEWAAIFVKNNINPGISIDGVNSKDNELRKQGYSFKKPLDILTQYNISPGILSVISRKNFKNFPKNLKNILHYAKGQTAIRANYVEDTQHPGLTKCELSGEELYANIYKPLLEKALASLAPPQESNLQSMINKFFDDFLYTTSPAKSNSNCYTKFCRGGNNIVEVEPTGEVNFCGRWDKIREISTIGHINKPDHWGLHSLYKALNLQLLKITDMRKKQCDYCPAATICDHGCIAFSYIKHQEKVILRKEISCDLYLNLHQLMMNNRYKMLILAAKQRNIPIRKTPGKYTILMPDHYKSKYSFIDKHITTANDPQRIIIPEKLMRQKHHV